MIATPAKELAKLCAQARARLAAAGRALHDDVGPLLAGAGMFLATGSQAEAMSALDKAMEHVRALSQELNASPVDRLGLQHALRRLGELDFKATAKLSRPDASTLYEMAAAAVEAAKKSGAEWVNIRVTGTKGVIIQVSDNGRSRGRAQALRIPVLLAQAAGLSVTFATKKSTIVSIRHAHRRSSGG